MNYQVVLGILGILVPLLHLMGFGFAAHAAMFSRTSQGAIAWVLSLIFFPYLAIPLYLVFGRRRFNGYVEARRRGDNRIDHLVDNLANALAPARAILEGESERFRVLENLTQLPFTAGNSARLLIDGLDTFRAIFAAIEKADAYLLIQFFIIRDDAAGRDLADRLIQRARAGVRVYFLFDEVGCIRLPKGYLNRLRNAGVRVRPFNTRRAWRNTFQINFRNHRKIVVADGKVAFVGGHNVGVEYLGQSSRFGHWRDTHVEVRGPAVAAIEWSFLEDWHWATQEILEIPTLVALPPRENTAAAIVVPTGPADELATCTLMFLAMISAAKKRFWIASPYFVPDETVYDALQLAAIRGVDVRIMLPAKPDHLLVYLSSFSYLESAERVGVKFYRYQAGFLHQKVLLVDEDLAAVGTANLDNRSMHLNFELTLLFADRSFAKEVGAMLEADFAKCERATPGDLGRRSLVFQVAVRIARLLSPIQ